MGVNMSITKNAKYGKPAYAALGKVDEEGAEGAEGAEEAAAPALEANSETIDKIKQENFDKWSKIFRDITRNKKIEKKIKSSFNKFKTEKLEGKTADSGESSKPQEGGEGDDAPAPAGDDAPAPAGDAPADMNDFMKFYSKGIKSSEDKVFEYMSGDDNYSFFLKEDIDKFWLVDEKVKELLDEQTAGLIVELGKNEKKFKKANEAKYNELSDVVTKITKEIVPIMFEKTQIAVQHKALKDILEYAIGSDELKDFHKKQNISGQKEAIKSGDVSADEVAMEKREKDAEAKEQKAAEKGPSGGGEDAISEGGYSSYGGYSSDSSSGGYSSDGGDSYMSGGDNIDGGKLFKTAEEKEYKKFKGEERKDFAEKKDKFMKDEVKVIAFLDANIESLMTSYKKNKIGVNVQKSSMKTNTALLEAIFTAVNSYEKEVETTGAAIEFIAKSGEAPAAEEGDKKEAGKEGKDGNGAGKEGEGEGEGKKGEKDGKDGAAGNEGGNQGGGGSHTTAKSTKTKKKRQPKKLPKNINININLGKTNIAYEDTSDSDSSSSDSSDISSSDSDDEEQGNVIKKGKKQVKYVVNTTAPKKKNRTKRRRQTNDEE